MDNNLIADYKQWEKGKDYPEWMNEVALSTISKGYLLPDETPRKAYKRVCLLYTSPSPRDRQKSRMPSSA